MKSFKKTILALGLTLCIIAGVGSASFAAYSTSTYINGAHAFANSFCYPYEGRSSTLYFGTGLVTLNTVYTYVNYKTLATSSMSRSDGANRREVSFRFIAPSNCRSLHISSSHLVYTGGQTWNVTTSHDW